MEVDNSNVVIRKKRRNNEHHRLPRVQGGTRKWPKGNISKVDTKRHEAWHTLFPGFMSVHQIVKELNKFWIDPRYQIVVEPTKEYLEELGENRTNGHVHMNGKNHDVKTS